MKVSEIICKYTKIICFSHRFAKKQEGRQHSPAFLHLQNSAAHHAPFSVKLLISSAKRCNFPLIRAMFCGLIF